MAEQKEIKGKKDKGKHEGKRAEIRRIQRAEQEVKDYLENRKK